MSMLRQKQERSVYLIGVGVILVVCVFVFFLNMYMEVFLVRKSAVIFGYQAFL